IRVAVPLLALAVPLFDTTLVVIARSRDRRPVFRGGTDHTSHRLAARGLTHVRVALLAIVAQAACSTLAFGLYVSSDGTLLAGTIVVAALSAGALLAMLRLEHPRAPAEAPSDHVVEVPESADELDTPAILNPQVNPLDG
ncbi:MAG TPA: hypothetical protein VFM40_07740, partial [Actinomycetota bacterium]|nr:hypothetical protein [Actinomycetota bacterium]